MRNLDVLIDFYKRNNPREEKNNKEKEKLMDTLDRRLEHFKTYPSGHKYYYDYDARELAALSLDYFIYGEEPVAKLLKNLADDIENKIRNEQVSAWEMLKLNMGLKDKIDGSKSYLDHYSEYGSEYGYLPVSIKNI